MLELTNINENNDNLQYYELIGICIYIKTSTFIIFKKIHLIRYHNILYCNVNYDTARKQIEVHNIEFSSIIFHCFDIYFIILNFNVLICIQLYKNKV